MRSQIKILILDHDLEEVERTTKCLIENGYTSPIMVCGDEESFLSQLDLFKPDVVLSEHVIQNYNSFKALYDARSKYPGIIFILVSDSISEEFAIELLKEGIDEYVLKNQLLRLPHTIESVFNHHREIEETKTLLKSNLELLEANKKIDTEIKNITQSIVFAERIQKLTLPSIDSILKEFPEAFILYKPKDIVSGDFYWLHKKDEIFMAVVADCTGHGVSGALLSVIGSNFLNEIVDNENNFLYPTDILSLLDLNMRNLLQQDGKSGYHDGIDIAFVSIDKTTKKIYFSGCKRPLLIYKRREKKIVEYKGEPYLIGGNDSRVSKTFSTQEIPYRSGDVLYMFSDGTVDQFGGDNNKKLMKERFIDILMSFKHLSLNYQGQLLEQKLNRWMNGYEQTDDILVVGIKL